MSGWRDWGIVFGGWALFVLSVWAMHVWDNRSWRQ